MKGELVEEYMEEYGSQLKIEYETQSHDGVNMKTGTMSGTMVCSESQSFALFSRNRLTVGDPSHHNVDILFVYP
jgi:hypothetical protein